MFTSPFEERCFFWFNHIPLWYVLNIKEIPLFLLKERLYKSQKSPLPSPSLFLIPRYVYLAVACLIADWHMTRP